MVFLFQLNACVSPSVCVFLLEGGCFELNRVESNRIENTSPTITNTITNTKRANTALFLLDSVSLRSTTYHR